MLIFILTGVGGDQRRRDGRGQDGSAWVRLHRDRRVRRRLQAAVRGAGRRQVLRADQGHDVRVGHVRRARHARVPGRHHMPLPRGRPGTAHLPRQDAGRAGPLQRGRHNRCA